MKHFSFTALPDDAGLAAELAAGDGAPRVYAVEPTGSLEDDPNVTDKKFPGLVEVEDFGDLHPPLAWCAVSQRPLQWLA